MSSGVEAVLAVLQEAGFRPLPRPLVVANSTFDFDAAVTGTGVSNDLVVVATSSAPPRRLARLLSGLSRTLDQLESRRPVTLVLLGGQPEPSVVADLGRHARVLTIGSPNPGPEEARDAVSVLLPLTLPSATSRGRDPLEEVLKFLGSHPSAEHRVLIEAASVGPDAVREALRRYVDGAAEGDNDAGEP